MTMATIMTSCCILHAVAIPAERAATFHRGKRVLSHQAWCAGILGVPAGQEAEQWKSGHNDKRISTGKSGHNKPRLHYTTYLDPDPLSWIKDLETDMCEPLSGLVSWLTSLLSSDSNSDKCSQL